MCMGCMRGYLFDSVYTVKYIEKLWKIIRKKKSIWNIWMILLCNFVEINHDDWTLITIISENYGIPSERLKHCPCPAIDLIDHIFNAFICYLKPVLWFSLSTFQILSVNGSTISLKQLNIINSIMIEWF